MQKSKLEEVVLEKLMTLKTDIARHDRGVMFGFLLSLLPIFPSALFGTVVGVFNFQLVESGKLNKFESNLIRKGLILGAINSIISLVMLYFLVHFFNDMGWPQVVEHLWETVQGFFRKLSFFNNYSVEKTTV